MKKLFYLFITFISTALSSCTDNDSLHDKNELLSVECYTRTSENEKNIVHDFSMYIFSNNFNGYPGVINPTHVTYSHGWDFPPISLSDEIANIYCFYPYTGEADCKSLELELIDQTNYLASNVVTANNKNPKVSIVMKHILSKISVRIDGSNQCKVDLLSIPTKGTYNLQTDEITPGEQSDLTTNSSDIYIFPCKEKQLKMNITYNGKEYDYIEIASDYEAGKEYTFNLTINNNKDLVIEGDVIITDWQPAGDFEGSVNEK